MTPSRPIATIGPMTRLGWGALGCVLALASCGSPDTPSGGTTTTTTSAVASTTTTSVSSSSSAHYTGTVTPPTGSPIPIDLSLFFNLPGASSLPHAIRPLAIYNITGGFNTNPNGFQGTVEGTFDGTPTEGGTFTGTLSTRMSSGCLAKRNYVGPLSISRVNWTAGSHVDSCGGQTPLTWNTLLNSVSTPPTTSVATTTVATTTVSTTTSVRTTTSSTSTTAPPRSNLLFTFTPNPVASSAGTSCIPSSVGQKVWLYTLSIQNASGVPFTISSWTTSFSSTAISQPNTYTAANFGQFFSPLQGGNTIAPDATARASLCAATTNQSVSGSLTHTFTGTNGNGPFTTPTATLSQ